MNKKNLPSFDLPRLVQGKTVTYINVYAEDADGNRQHYRRTYNLNRIHNLKEREERGKDLVAKIKFWLMRGLLFQDFNERVCIDLISKGTEQDNSLKMNIVEAIEMVRDEKMSETERRTTKRTYQSNAKMFIDFLKLKKIDGMDIGDFSTFDARAYVNYWIKEQGITNNNTFNSKLLRINVFFNWLVANEYISKNPFDPIKSRKATKALKDNFTQTEMIALWKHLRQENKWMWVASKLAFWGLIRQEEIARLQFKHFNFDKWCIDMDATMTKNWKPDIITLPFFLRKEFKEIGFFEQPYNYHVIGAGIEPSRTKISERELYSKFRKPLSAMYKSGDIEKRKGLSFSSWRRTGMDFYSRKISPREFKDHNRHDSFSTTEKYLPNRKIIASISQIQPF